MCIRDSYEAIAGEGRMLSKRLKEALNYRKGGNTGFETVSYTHLDVYKRQAMKSS